ncbi:LPS export ABC transporter permease LptG [Oceaniserpentilla sp. 4NH20-0058]|uniref:LPS export ABC transporter permease LptG n=1 Tax=Oceaniserpentilla sp. 4NH20-0058 TaxID=3127660 RepID=UPI0031075112
MRKIDAHIRSSVLNAILAVLLVLTMLDMVIALLNQLDNIRSTFTFWDAVYYVVASSPTRLYEMIPMITLIGCLAGLGGLATHSELTAIRAAGVSTQRITYSTVKAASIMMVLGLLMGEYIVPDLERMSTSFRTIALGRSVAENNEGKGHWHREGDNYMRFAAIEPNGVLHGLTVYEFDDEKQLTVMTHAKRAIYQRGEWSMENVSITKWDEINTISIKRQTDTFQTELTPDRLKFVAQKPGDMAISTLFRYSQYLEAQGLGDGEFMLAFWKKVLQPVSIFALVLVGISFIFGPLRSVTMGQRLFSGIMVGLVYKIAVDLFGPMGLLFGIGPLLANLIPIILCLIWGGWMLRRAS